jgi:hypothetical protein
VLELRLARLALLGQGSSCREPAAADRPGRRFATSRGKGKGRGRWKGRGRCPLEPALDAALPHQGSRVDLDFPALRERAPAASTAESPNTESLVSGL